MLVGITGHREVVNPKETKEKVIELFDSMPVERVLNGLAIGFDSLVLDVCLELNIPYEAYCPFVGQEEKFNKEQKEKYQFYLSKADKVIFVSSGGFANWKYHVRNQKIVNDCDLLVCYVKPSQQYGGSYQTKKYAIQKRRPIENVF